MRDSFVFYRSFLEAIRCIPEESRARALLAVVEYGCGEEPDVDPNDWIVNSILAIAKPNIDSAVKKRTDGRKGGRPKKPVVETTLKPVVKTSGYEDGKPMVETTLKPVGKSNVNVNVNENVNVNGNGEVNVTSLIDDKDVAEALSNWLQVRMQVGLYPYGAITSTVDSCKRSLAKYGKQACLAAIKEATDGAWKAIRWPKESKQKNGFSSMQNNEYDFDDLEKRLLSAQEV